MKSKKTHKQITENLIKSPNLFPVVGIGASAGGLDAFKKLLKAIPENSGMAYVLVQHLDPTHESMLPELLQKVTSIPVLEISDDIKVEPNHVYVIPSNKMMLATDGVLQLAPRPAKSKTERNLPIDLFFTSLAVVHESHAIGVVLSGTGSDGTMGLKAIKDHGGITIAQDEASATYEGMPHSAVHANVVDFVLPPEKISQKLLEIISNIDKSDEDLQNLPQKQEEAFKQILSLLRIRKGADFTYYKQTTIRRRILRRMALNKNTSPDSYLKYLRENKTEQDVLFQDMLIPVTSFFRDPKTFNNLCEKIFPHIVKNKTPGEIIRVWVVGCSTGEEAYSIAICFKEFLNENQRVQIFATDLSEPAIAKARAGIYTKREVEDVAPQRLQEFFKKTNGSYHLNKNIRDICVFAVHNFLKDPPFGKMDFISCRNVLIYMEPYLQKKALTTFHYSLNPKGFLLLGKTETISGVPDLFLVANQGSNNDKLFNRKDVPGKFMHVASQRSEQNLSPVEVSTGNEITRPDFQKTADDIILRKYTPAGVLVNEAMDIVHFRGKTGNYLEQSPGKPSHNLLQMAKNGLAFELRNLLHKAKKQKTSVIKENIPMQIEGSITSISIEVLPLPNSIEPYYLILFHDQAITGNQKLKLLGKRPGLTGKEKSDSRDLRIQQLEQELEQTREDMRSITEDQEAANEELQSANEELLSSSEELQSLNEELETGKEELQSTNEELMVINHEIISLNEQLTEARDYAEAIVSNLHEPLLVLDKNMRIKSANNAFYKTFRLNEPETEGVLIYDLGQKNHPEDKLWNIPALRTLLEKILPEKLAINNYEISTTFSTVGERTLLLNAREVINKNSSEKLILLSIEDITERKKAQEFIRKSGERFRELVKELPAAVYSCDAKGYITFYNYAAVKLWGRTPVVGKDRWSGSYKLFNPDGILLSADKCPMAITLEDGHTEVGKEIIFERPDGSRSTVLVHSQPEFNISGEITGAINMLFDITEQVLAKKALEESETRFRQMAELMPQKVWTSDAKGNKNYFNKTLLDYSGKTSQELEGKGWENIMHPDDWKQNKKDWEQSLKTGKKFEAENRLLRKDGTYLWHLTQAVPIKNKEGNIKMWIGAKTEIQEQKKQKEVLEKAITDRTQELKKANENLKEKNEELLKMNTELEAFAYVSSHDLQEPLRKIQTFSSLILERENENLTTKGKDYFLRMQATANRMQILIEDLLSYSRTSTSERKFKKTDLGIIIKQVQGDLKDIINEKHAVIKTTLLSPVNIIPFQFRQLMHNLISNALKFSKPKRPPHISITNKIVKGSKIKAPGVSPKKNYCHISVADNGIGFEKEFNEKIFEVFQKLHSKDEYPGTGIGLAIVKKIVDNHRGIITATSRVNKGATFDIYIPAD